MSERYGTCRHCSGRGCGMCGDTGFSGDVDDYLNHHMRWVFGLSSRIHESVTEEQMFEDVRTHTEKMNAAVAAFENTRTKKERLR